MSEAERARSWTAPLRAMAELRLRLTLRRLFGKGGVPELVAKSVMFAMALPSGILLAVWVGRNHFHAIRGGVPDGAFWATFLLFFGVWQAWTAMALTVSDREAFDLRRLLVYPVPPWQSYAYELAAGLVGDPFALFWGLLLLGALAGAGLGRPGAWILLLALVVLLFAAAVVAGVALVQELLARALRWRRFREVGVASIYIALLAGTLRLGTGGVEGFVAAMQAALAFRWVVYPAALAAEAARRLYLGQLAGALPWIAGLAVAAAATAWAAYRLAIADALAGAEGGRAHGAADGQGWRLPGRLAPMLEKELKYLLRHPLSAVLALVVPAIAAVVGWWALPFLSDPFWRATPLLGFALYGLVVTQSLWLNAFGWDRGGARFWFLAPVDLVEVLRAKNAAARTLAFALFAVSAAALFATGGSPSPAAVVAALALHLGVGTWWVAAGNFVSILNPRPSSHVLQRGANLAPMSALVGMAIISGGTGLFLVPALLTRRWPALAAAWVALGLAGAAVRQALLPYTARLLARRREALLAAVTGDDV